MTDLKLSLMVLRSSRLEETRRFYESLGLQFREEKHGKGPVHYSCSLGSMVMELYPVAEGELASNVRLGLIIPGLRGVLEKLRHSPGVILKEDVSEKGEPQALLRDPDGRKVELAQGS